MILERKTATGKANRMEDGRVDSAYLCTPSRRSSTSLFFLTVNGIVLSGHFFFVCFIAIRVAKKDSFSGATGCKRAQERRNQSVTALDLRRVEDI